LKEIPLTQGKVALVDDGDYNYLNQFKWCVAHWRNGYYAVRKEKSKVVIMHRVIMNAPKNKVIDHIDGNGLNNLKSNLRIVSNRQNLQNRHVNKTSKYPGVSWYKRLNKWHTQIRIKNKQKDLGYFENERKAAKAYERECRELGEELICKTSSK
jgi:hypothetical protein